MIEAKPRLDPSSNNNSCCSSKRASASLRDTSLSPSRRSSTASAQRPRTAPQQRRPDVSIDDTIPLPPPPVEQVLPSQRGSRVSQDSAVSNSFRGYSPLRHNYSAVRDSASETEDSLFEVDEDEGEEEEEEDGGQEMGVGSVSRRSSAMVRARTSSTGLKPSSPLHVQQQFQRGRAVGHAEDGWSPAPPPRQLVAAVAPTALHAGDGEGTRLPRLSFDEAGYLGDDDELQHRHAEEQGGAVIVMRPSSAARKGAGGQRDPSAQSVQSIEGMHAQPQVSYEFASQQLSGRSHHRSHRPSAPAAATSPPHHDHDHDHDHHHRRRRSPRSSAPTTSPPRHSFQFQLQQHLQQQQKQQSPSAAGRVSPRGSESKSIVELDGGTYV